MSFSPSTCTLVRPRDAHRFKVRSPDLTGLALANVANIFGLTRHSGNFVLLTSPAGFDAVAELHVFSMTADGQVLALCKYWDSLSKNRFKTTWQAQRLDIAYLSATVHCLCFFLWVSFTL